MWRYLSVFSFLWLLAMLGQAVPVITTLPVQLVGIADLIVIGSVAHSQQVGPMQYTATVSIQRTLKGPEQKVVKLVYPPMVGPGEHNVFLAENKPYLLVLRQNQRGYELVTGVDSVRQITEVPDFEKALADIMLTVAVKLPSEPLYFGVPRQVMVTVVNHHATAVMADLQGIESYFLSPRMAETNLFRLHSQSSGQQNEKASTTASVLVQPGQAETIPVTVGGNLPASWALVPPDTFFLTPLRLRIIVSPRIIGAYMIPCNIASPWVDALVGYKASSSLSSNE